MPRQKQDNRTNGRRLASSDIAVKTAWLYYVEGMTQQQIAERLGVSRVKVMRTLAECVAGNLVVTTVSARTAAQIERERALEARWNLSSAIVVPTPGSDGNLERAIGHAVAGFVEERVDDGMTLAIGGGATLHASLGFLRHRRAQRLSVVGLVGSLPHSRWVNPSIVAAKVAEIFDGVSYQINAPVVVDAPDLRRRLWKQDTLQDVLARAARADLALLTVGDMSHEATIFRHEIVPSQFIEPLKRQGAVANILCHFIDAEGRLVEHEINDRIMAVDLDIVARIPNVVLAAGGKNKAQAINAAMKAINVSVLITDMETAEDLLDD